MRTAALSAPPSPVLITAHGTRVPSRASTSASAPACGSNNPPAPKGATLLLYPGASSTISSSSTAPSVPSALPLNEHNLRVHTNPLRFLPPPSSSSSPRSRSPIGSEGRPLHPLAAAPRRTRAPHPAAQSISFLDDEITALLRQNAAAVRPTHAAALARSGAGSGAGAGAVSVGSGGDVSARSVESAGWEGEGEGDEEWDDRTGTATATGTTRPASPALSHTSSRASFSSARSRATVGTFMTGSSLPHAHGAARPSSASTPISLVDREITSLLLGEAPVSGSGYRYGAALRTRSRRKGGSEALFSPEAGGEAAEAEASTSVEQLYPPDITRGSMAPSNLALTAVSSTSSSRVTGSDAPFESPDSTVPSTSTAPSTSTSASSSRRPMHLSFHSKSAFVFSRMNSRGNQNTAALSADALRVHAFERPAGYGTGSPAGVAGGHAGEDESGSGGEWGQAPSGPGPGPNSEVKEKAKTSTRSSRKKTGVGGSAIGEDEEATGVEVRRQGSGLVFRRSTKPTPQPSYSLPLLSPPLPPPSKKHSAGKGKRKGAMSSPPLSTLAPAQPGTPPRFSSNAPSGSTSVSASASSTSTSGTSSPVMEIEGLDDQGRETRTRTISNTSTMMLTSASFGASATYTPISSPLSTALYAASPSAIMTPSGSTRGDYWSIPRGASNVHPPSAGKGKEREHGLVDSTLPLPSPSSSASTAPSPSTTRTTTTTPPLTGSFTMTGSPLAPTILHLGNKPTSLYHRRVQQRDARRGSESQSGAGMGGLADIGEVGALEEGESTEEGGMDGEAMGARIEEVVGEPPPGLETLVATGVDGVDEAF